MGVRASLMATENGYSARIKQHFQRLVRCIDPSASLLTELFFIDCLTADELSQVKSASTNEDKNALLLMTLCSKSTDVVDQFITLLERYEQSHVANVLRGSDGIQPMSQQHFELLRKKRNEMCDYINPSVNLLTFLESREVLTPRDTERIIRSKQIDREKSDELLRTLGRKQDSAFDSFIDCLNQTGQNHVAYILTGEGETPIAKHKIRLLDQKRCEFAQCLEPVDSDFVDELLSQGVVTQEEYQRVKEERNTYEQSLYLVDIFKRKSNRAFDCFIAALRKTGQGHLVNLLFRCVNGTVTLNGSFPTDQLPELEGSMVRDMEAQGSLNQLHEHGIYSSVDKGSIKIRFSCMTAGSLTKLRELHESGTIDELLYENQGRKLSELGVQSVTVHIQPSEFEAAESCTLMAPHHRRLLQSAADTFASRLIVSERLLSRLSLCSRRRAAILSQPTGEERSRLLFSIVSRQADPAFQQLVDALRDVGYMEVAEFLNGNSSQPSSPASRCESIYYVKRPYTSKYTGGGLDLHTKETMVEHDTSNTLLSLKKNLFRDLVDVNKEEKRLRKGMVYSNSLLVNTCFV